MFQFLHYMIFLKSYIIFIIIVQNKPINTLKFILKTKNPESNFRGFYY